MEDVTSDARNRALLGARRATVVEKKNFRAKCSQSGRKLRQPVNTIYSVGKHVVELDDEQTVTLRLQWKSAYIRFQIDNGASVNILPLHIYAMASGDANADRLLSSDTKTIRAYGNQPWPVLGEVIVRVWGKRRTCLVRLLIVEEQFNSILGRNACIELGCLKICNNDALHKPTALSAQVYVTQQVAAVVPLTIDDLKRNYQSMFSGDADKLPGQYHIQLDTSVHPVKNAHRPVAVAMRKRVKSTLDEMAARHNRTSDDTNGVDFIDGGRRVS